MIKYLLQKEFIQIRRNSFLPRLIFMFPIVVMCVAPWVMNMEVKNVNVAVVDLDRSTASARLTERISQSDYFTVASFRSSYAEAIEDIEKSRADIVLEIPRDYERNMVNGGPSQPLIAANAVNGMNGSIGASYLSQVITVPSNSPRGGELITQTNQNLPHGGRQEGASTVNYYNPRLDYKLFMIPALMSILMMMLCGFLPALNIVGEKEAGTIEQINVTPVRKSTFILSKLIPYWTIGMIVLTICFLLSWLVYDIVPAGNLLLLYLTSILLAFIFSGFGLLISNYSDTMQQAIFVMWFFVVCMMLLSGLFTPVSSMPDWAQRITIFNPVRYYVDAMRTVFIRGGGLESVYRQLSALAIFALVFDLMAVYSYKKNG